MWRWCVRPALASALVLGLAASASAQTTVALPNQSQQTILTANVSEQARVTVPAGISFGVTSVAASTAAPAASVAIDNIVLATGTKQLQVSLQANAASFTSPDGSTTWSAGDVTWNAATWTNATGAAGTLSNSAFNNVAQCAQGVASCSTAGLVFTLAPNTSVVRSGSHTLVVSWKFESIGS
jgi:hypothetical protein